MSLTTMSAWYMDTWVNSPLPVTSPMAHTRSVPSTRRWSSTGKAPAASSTPIDDTFSWARSARRPVATSSRSDTTGGPSPTATVKRRPSWWIEADVHSGAHGDPLRGEDLRQEIARFGFFRTDQARSGFEHGHLGTEATEHLGQLDTDGPTAEHGQRVRNLLGLDGLAIGPVGRVGQSGHRRDEGPGPYPDDHRTRRPR